MGSQGGRPRRRGQAARRGGSLASAGQGRAGGREGARAAPPPRAVSGRRLKLNYTPQPKARPPSFVVFCTRADAVPEGYRRYLVNALREAFDLPGVTIRLTIREKANPYAGRKKG